MRPFILISAIFIVGTSMSMASSEVSMPAFPKASGGWLEAAESGRVESYQDYADFVAQQNFVRRTYLGLRGRLAATYQNASQISQRCRTIESEAQLNTCRDQILSLRSRLVEMQLNLYAAFQTAEFKGYASNRSPELDRLILESDQWRSGLSQSLARIDQMLNRLKVATVAFYQRQGRSTVERQQVEIARETLCRMRPHLIRGARSSIRLAISSAVHRKDPWMLRVAEQQVVTSEGDLDVVRRLCPTQARAFEGFDQTLASLKSEIARQSGNAQILDMVVHHCQTNVHPKLSEPCQQGILSDEFLYSLHLAIRGRLE